ncbi:hypothetical protein K438DRAFT_2021138 [Mycena galopus ATCC 62051]|nr:hypothetical protein K438DRAFT_2021138 [Mycena galopus ATCC 62051]
MTALILEYARCLGGSRFARFAVPRRQSDRIRHSHSFVRGTGIGSMTTELRAALPISIERCVAEPGRARYVRVLHGAYTNSGFDNVPSAPPSILRLLSHLRRIKTKSPTSSDQVSLPTSTYLFLAPLQTQMQRTSPVAEPRAAADREIHDCCFCDYSNDLYSSSTTQAQARTRFRRLNFPSRWGEIGTEH